MHFEIRVIIKKNGLENLNDFEKYFLEYAGSTKCGEIRNMKRLSCIGCIEKSCSFLEYYKKGNVDVKVGIIICIAVLLGSALGGRIVQYIPISILKKGFAVFMILISIKMLLENK